MRAMATAALAVSLCARVLAANEPAPGLGNIRLGMSLDQVRAANPEAAWNVREEASASAKQALTVAGLTFDVVYADESWDRYSLRVKRDLPSPTTAAGCRDDILRFLAAIEEANSPLAAPALKSDFDGSQEILRVGKSSEARSLVPAKWPSTEIRAEQIQGAIKINAFGAIVQRLPTSATGDESFGCYLGATFEVLPPRPPQGVVPFLSLQVKNDASIGLLHHSLDGAPELPPQGVDVDLDCTISDYGSGELACKEPSATNTTAAPFFGAALKRAKQMRVSRRTKDGKWTPGERTLARVHFAAGDRRQVGVVDLSKSHLLRMIGKLPPPRFPLKAADSLPNGPAASAQVRCIVQSDGSLICPEIQVKAERFAEDFRDAILAAMLRVRFEPLLSNGESSAGVGYRTEIEFRLG